MMGKLGVNCFSVSLDGFGAGPNQDLQNPLGVGGMALHDRSTAADRRALRQLAGLLCGRTFLALVDDLCVCPASTLTEAPSLGSCYAAMRAGVLDVQTPRGRASTGLALLAQGVTGMDAAAER